MIVLPATTSDVPMKASMAVAQRGLRSASARDASRHRHVAAPSTTAPYSAGTCHTPHDRHYKLTNPHVATLVPYSMFKRLIDVP